jgi:tetratricopeptide (TPR) repeat protein
MKRHAGSTAALILALCIASIAACAGTPDPSAFVGAGLHGVVFDEGGAPVGWAEIRIAGGSPVHSDINGRFLVPNVGRGRVRVEVVKEGYEPLDAEVEFMRRTQVAYLRVYSASHLAELAEEHADAGRFERAIECAARAVAAMPGSEQLTYLAAVIHARAGRYAQARALLQDRWPLIVADMADHTREEYEHETEDRTRLAITLLLERISGDERLGVDLH